MTYEIKYRNEDEMKDSGIAEARLTPNTWKKSKLKHIFELKSGEMMPKEEYDDNGIYEIYGSNGKIGRCNKRNVIKKSIIIGRVGASGLLNIGENIWVSDNALVVDIKNSNINFNYILYLLISKNLSSMSIKTAQPLITGTQIKNLHFYQPDIDEQQKIANFLDLKTSEFDSIISKKELLIEKLEEAKKSLISEVVTGKVKIVDGELVERKADEMKDSEVEWLGMIPKDWEVKRLKHYTIKAGSGKLQEEDRRYT